MAKIASVSINIRRWANSKDELTEKLITECIPYSWEAAQKAYHYALRILKKRWPLGEKCILEKEQPRMAYLYAKNVIKGRWPEAEDLIATDEHSSYYYSKYVLKGRFIKFEDSLSKPRRGTKIWRSEEYLYLYARHIQKKRLARKEERRIAKNANAAVQYHVHVVKNGRRWKEAEPGIVTSYSGIIDLYLRSLKNVKDRRDFRTLLLAETMSNDNTSRWGWCPAKKWFEENENSSDPVLFS